MTVSEFGVLLQNGFCDGLMYVFRSLNNFGHLGRRESLNFDGAIAVGSKSRSVHRLRKNGFASVQTFQVFTESSCLSNT